MRADMKKMLVSLGVIVALGVMFGVYRQSAIPESVVVVYTPLFSEFMDSMNKLFEETYPDIKVQTVRGSTTVLEDRIRSEKTHPLGDVMFAGDLPTYMQLKKHNLIQPINVANAENIPAGMKDTDKTWYAMYQLPGVVFYNDGLVTAAQAPKDWKDLIAPEWKGAVSIRNPTQSGTARAFYLSLIMAWGEEAAFDFFKKLDAQMDGNYVASNDKLMMAIVRGEAKISVLNEADILLAHNDKKLPLSVVYPSSGAFVMPEPIALIAGAPHAEAGQKYINFVLSFPALELAAHKFYKRPTRMDYPKDKLPKEFQTPLKALPVDWLSIGDQGTAWLEKWSEEVWHKKKS
jgi:iron(III) transport system substrate-binding protein